MGNPDGEVHITPPIPSCAGVWELAARVTGDSHVISSIIRQRDVCYSKKKKVPSWTLNLLGFLILTVNHNAVFSRLFILLRSLIKSSEIFKLNLSLNNHEPRCS